MSEKLATINGNTGIGTEFVDIFNRNCTTIEQSIDSVNDVVSSLAEYVNNVRRTVSSMNTSLVELGRKYDTLIDKYDELLEKYNDIYTKYPELKNDASSGGGKTQTRSLSLSKGVSTDNMDEPEEGETVVENYDTDMDSNGSEYDGEEENDIK